MDCYDDCSGVAGWSIEIYDAPPYDECCEVPCEEPVYTCSGTDCPVECVTPCLEAYYTDGLTEFYVIFSMWDKVGNRLQEGAMVTMSDTCEIESIIPYTGAVGEEGCVDPLYLTNLCGNDDDDDDGEYTLTVNIIGNGSVTKNPLEVTYTSGTVVALDPEADTGWHFIGWSGDLTGTDDPENITMDENKTVTAVFTQNEYSLTVLISPAEADSAGCTVDLSGDDTAPYNYGDVVTLTSDAAAGWTFDHWSGALTGSTDPDDVTIDGDKTVTANFGEGPAPVNLRTAGDFVILTKSGITTTVGTSIVGDIGVSPIASTAITGFGLIMDISGTFSKSSLVIGKV